jgi:hypothetical protein
MNVQLDIEAGGHSLSAVENARLTQLMERIVCDDSLPAPAPESIFVGDGDYRTIGVEYLGHFVRIGGLTPHDRVLDI